MKLQELKRALSKKLERMNELNALVIDKEGKVRKFTDDEQSEYDRLEAETEEAKAVIERMERAAASSQVVKNLDAPANQAPNIQVIREEDHNENGEYRGYGEMKRGGYGQFLRDIQREAIGHGTTDKLRKLRAATGANEGVGSEGGYLVQSDHAEMLFSVAKDAGKLASRCTEIPMSSNSTSITLLDETSLAVGSQFGGIRAYWRAEAGTVSATKPKFRQENVRAEALEALFYATEEQLEDAPQLEAFANLAFAEAIGWQIDDAILSGDGAGKPLGILNSPAAISVAKVSGQTADTVVYENVDSMIDRLMVGSEERAVWYIHPDVKQQLRNITATPGSLTDFMPFMPANGISGKPYDTLLGYPLERIQQARALGDLGDISLLDLKWYALFRKAGIKASQSVHVAFLTSENVFKWTVRLNGMPLLNSAITDAYGSTTRSPFVLLAARA